MMGSASSRLTVLVVEDERLLGEMLKEALLDAGYRVLHGQRVDETLFLLHSEVIHAAILDINIGNDLVFPVAERLERLNIPYIFASAADPAIVPHEYAARPHLGKPYRVQQVMDLLSSLVTAPDDASTPPIPD